MISARTNRPRAASNLPSAVRSKAAEAGFCAAGASTEDTERPCILLAGTDGAALESLAAPLRAGNFAQVETATDLEAALRRCGALRPALVVLDLDIGPGCFDLMHRLLAADHGYPPAILAVVPENDHELRQRALRGGATDLLTQPFDEGEMVARVRAMTEAGHLRRRLEDQNRALEDVVAKRTKRLENAISVLQQAEMKLFESLSRSEKTSRGKSDFLAKISHEIRTPLNAVTGYTALLAEELADPVHRDYAGRAHEAAEFALALVSEILDFSKAEAGKLEIRIADVDLPKTIRSCMRLMEQRAREAGVALKVDIAENFPTLRSDEKRLKQIILNLVTNAIKFTPAGGSVTVKAWAEPDQGAFILVVSDTGIGIPPDQLELVMTPYGQVKSRAGRAREGTGLGLPFTKSLVERLGGTLEIESGVGGGTAVTLRFPIDCPAAAPT